MPVRILSKETPEMCVAVADAEFGTTQIAGARVSVGGRPVHLLIYGNQPTNRIDGPNAIVLHIPIAPGTFLTQDSFLPTTGLSELLDDMWRAAPKFVAKSMAVSFGATARGSVIVFQMGMYTWVVANRAVPSEVLAALQTVRPAGGPVIRVELIAWYLNECPGDALAIGCFNRARGEKAEPVAIQYEPRDWDILRMPAIDAHGSIPRFGITVIVRHRLIIGTDEFGVGGVVDYSERELFDPRLAAVLPRLVIGAELLGLPMDNGDFYADFGRFRRDNDRFDMLRARGRGLSAGSYPIPVLTTGE